MKEIVFYLSLFPSLQVYSESQEHILYYLAVRMLNFREFYLSVREFQFPRLFKFSNSTNVDVHAAEMTPANVAAAQ